MPRARRGSSIHHLEVSRLRQVCLQTWNLACWYSCPSARPRAGIRAHLVTHRWQTPSSVQSQNRPMFLYAVSPSNCWPPVLLVSALLCCASAMTMSPMPPAWHRSSRNASTSPVKYLVGVRGQAALDPLALWAYQRTVARMLGNSSHLP